VQRLLKVLEQRKTYAVAAIVAIVGVVLMVQGVVSPLEGLTALAAAAYAAAKKAGENRLEEELRALYEWLRDEADSSKGGPYP